MIRRLFRPLPLAVLAILASLAPWTAAQQTARQPHAESGRGERTEQESDVTHDETAPDELVSTLSSHIADESITGIRSTDGILELDVALTFAAVPDPSAAAFAGRCQRARDTPASLTTLVRDLGLSIKGRITHPSCSGYGRESDPFQIRFHLHQEELGNRFYLSLFESPALVLDEPGAEFMAEPSVEPNSGGNANPVQPRLLNPVSPQTAHVSLRLARGWRPDPLPAPIHADSPFASLDLTAAFDDQVLTVDRRLILKKSRVEPGERERFGAWLDPLAEASLARTRLSSPDSYPWSAFDGKAAALLSEAERAIGQHQLDEAENFLTQAAAADPSCERLHEIRGLLAVARKQYDLAIREFHRELQDFPTVLLEYGFIAETEKLAGHPLDAVQTLEQWMVAAPDSTEPVILLMQLQHDLHRDDLAAAAGNRAMLSLSEDSKRSVRFLSLYGRVQHLTHQDDAAAHTLSLLLPLTSDLRPVNNAAYLLAESGGDLDLAEQSVRASLAELEPAVDVGYMSEPDYTSFMLATWDTLGYILLRKGAPDQAEPWIRAAWHHRQTVDLGLHLGQILLAQDKPAQALDVFLLAQATLPEPPAANPPAGPATTARPPVAASAPPADSGSTDHGSENQSGELDSDIDALREEIAALEARGVQPTLPTPAAIKSALAALQTVDLPRTPALAAATRCNVVLKPGTALFFPVANSRISPELAPVKQQLPPEAFPPGTQVNLSRTADVHCSAKTCTLKFRP